MSLENRKKAVDLIEGLLESEFFAHVPKSSATPAYIRAISSSILNTLLRAGFLNDNILVHADEIKDELSQSVFQCRVEE